MKIEVYMDRAGKFRWRFKSQNGRIMADSGQGYTERHNALRAARDVATGLTQALEIDEVYYLYEGSFLR